MSFADYLSKKSIVAEAAQEVEVPEIVENKNKIEVEHEQEQLDERTQEERDAEWKAIKLSIYKESKNLNKAFHQFESLVSKYPTLNAEFTAFKKFYPFNKALAYVSNDIQEWVSEMEDEAKS